MGYTQMLIREVNFEFPSFAVVVACFMSLIHKCYDIWFVAVENSTKDSLIKRTTSMLRTVLEDLESPHSVLQAESSALTNTTGLTANAADDFR